MPRHQHEALVSKTANYTATLADKIISCSGTFTVTLPTAVGCTGREYIIKNTDTGVITVDGDGTETIDGELTQTLNQWDAMAIVSNGTGWSII
jgi:hypothetical protein